MTTKKQYKDKLIGMKSRHSLLIIFIVSTALVFGWFNGGEHIGSGESGLWLFNPRRSLELFSTIWVDHGAGTMIPFYLPRIPAILFAVALSSLFSSWISQAAIYFFLISSGLIGMYLLAKELLRDKKEWVHLVISLFYLLNLYSLTQVWHRLIYSGMFSWSYLPLLLFLSIRWIEGRKVKYLLFIVISSFVYATSFSTISFVVTVWMPVGLYVLINLWGKRKDFSEMVNIILSSITMFSLWGIASIWWFYPVLNSGSKKITSFIDIFDTNFNSLRGVSQYFTTSDIVLLRQSYFFSSGDMRDSFWNDFYNKPFVYLLSYIGFMLVIIGLYRVIEKNHKHKIFFVSVLFIGWFLSKGSNPPLGYTFYRLIFENLGFTMMFRNPYEKLGLLFLLPYSILFGVGLNVFSEKVGKMKSLFILLILFLVNGILVWPLWTGDVYSKSTRVNVPSYYQEANKIIDVNTDDSRVLILPLIDGESASYTWGYRGVVPMNFLFEKPVIAMPVSNIYPLFRKINNAFLNGDSDMLYPLLEQLNVGSVVLVGDLNPGVYREQRDKLYNFLENDRKFTKLGKAGELVVYSFNGNRVGEQIVAEGNNVPTLEYSKINPARYRVKVTDAQEEYNLIFKSAYDDFWIARIGNDDLTEHASIYDYANKWKVYEKGSYEIEIFLKTWPWE